MARGGELLSESHTLIDRLQLTTNDLTDDVIHAVVRDLTSHIADVTSLSDVIGRRLESTCQVYEHLDQVTVTSVITWLKLATAAAAAAAAAAVAAAAAALKT